MPLGSLLGGYEPLVAHRRRHPDVDDRDVGPVPPDLGEELVGGAGLGSDRDARSGQHAREAFAQDGCVVGQHYTHGSSAWMVVPCPGRLAISTLPSRAWMRSVSPRRPEPRNGSAPPMPSSTRSTVTVRSS